jgi:D-alanyl-D-alanine carboxypeptidase/D-alanyl-D-alanine-endopeptidase (penicillin-binding protein 4)
MQRKYFVGFLFFSVLIVSCSVNKQIGKLAQQDILTDSNFAPAHVGISLYDANEKKYVYNYQGDKYFVPASNTKLLTCYAAMKYLGDSLVGLRYSTSVDGSAITIVGNGDPTFLHPDFTNQQVLNFLKKFKNIGYLNDNFLTQFTPLGNGWAWNDYDTDYMQERSEFPIYGNVVKFYLKNDSINVEPHFFYNDAIKFSNNYNSLHGLDNHIKIQRPFENNEFHGLGTKLSQSKFSLQNIPFKTRDLNNPNIGQQLFIKLLEDTLHKILGIAQSADGRTIFKNVIHSQPTDSLLKITMHRSDNFFAEQTLLMVSNEKLGVMSDAKIIDTLLKTDYKDMPQKPKWVDGSGLSRYNLISPQDFVFVLEKMKNEFDWKRITTILPTGNDGTLSGYYKNYAGKIYAKTGTLSNNVSLSGYIITNKGKQFIFSVQVNNHQTSASAIRRSIEKFLTTIIDQY